MAKRRVNRLEILRHVSAQELVLGGVDHDAEMGRVDAGIRSQVPEHLDHVVGAHVERIGGERRVEEALGLGLAPDLHVEHAQADRGIRAVRVGGCGHEERTFRGVVLAAVGQPLA